MCSLMSAAAEAGWIEIARSQKRDLPFKGQASEPCRRATKSASASRLAVDSIFDTTVDLVLPPS